MYVFQSCLSSVTLATMVKPTVETARETPLLVLMDTTPALKFTSSKMARKKHEDHVLMNINVKR